jgi:hypothetical protein
MDRIEEILALLGKIEIEKAMLMAEYKYWQRIAYHNVLAQLFFIQCQLIDLKKADHVQECSLVYEHLLACRAKLDKQLIDLESLPNNIMNQEEKEDNG